MEIVDTRRVQELVERGAQLLEVLPEEDHRREHLPGARNIPLPELTPEAAERVLDRDRPVVTYCFDLQCDLSSRAAARLSWFGFPEVYDYADSKVAWLAMGLPAEGTVPRSERAGALARPAATFGQATALADLPEAGPGGVVLVVDDHQRVLGLVDPTRLHGAPGTAGEVAHPGPTSVRPSITADELAQSMDKAGEAYVVVSRLDGVLLGIVERDDLDHVDR
jgi:rhodanese-related sulfurtransferase